MRNKTSGVPPERSMALIEKDLAKAGARAISKFFDEKGNCEGFMFQIESNNMPLVFKLPVRWQKCYEVMMRDIKKIHTGTKDKVLDQAQRTAWKLLYEWIQIQLTLIQLEQVEVSEVFLPYLYNQRQDKTLFELAKESGFKQLTA